MNDAEDAPQLVEAVFGSVTVERWNVIAYVLPDSPAIADYLRAFDIEDWRRRATQIEPPLTITKRGAQVWARR